MTSSSGTDRIGFAPEADEFFTKVDRFRVGALDPQSEQWGVSRTPDEIALREAASLGLTGVQVPKALGGLGLGFREKVRALEILSRTSMSFAFALVNTHNVAAQIAEAGSDEHRSELLPSLLNGTRLGSTALTEPDVGSDFASITTTAVRSGSSWRISGEKAWITNAALSDVVVCYVQTRPGSGRRGIASFLIDGTRPGFQRHEPYAISAGHAIGAGSFSLDDYRAGEQDMISAPGDAFAAALAGVNGARIYVAAMACAMARSALATAVEYGSDRTAFGRALLDHQGLAWSLADVANQLEAAELLTARAISVFDPTSGDMPGIDEVVLRAAHAKRFATRMVEPAIAACIQAMGAEGLRDFYPLYRQLAEARILSLVDGSTEMQNNRIARSLRSHYGNSSLAEVSVARRSSELLAAPAEENAPEAIESTTIDDQASEQVLTGVPPMPDPSQALAPGQPPLPPDALRQQP